MSARTVLLVLGTIGLAACEEMELVVESNTSWSGQVQGLGEVSGKGNTVIDVIDASGDRCWTLRKTTDAGVLRAFLRDKGGWFGAAVEYDGEATTTAPYGEIAGCNS